MTFLTALISPVFNTIQNYQSRKKAKESAKAKLKMAKQNNDYNLQLSDAEWQSLGKQAESDSFKDEWITIIITIPIPIIFFGAILSAYTANPIYIESINAGIDALKLLLPNFSKMLEVVVYAGVSIKGFSILSKKVI